MLFERKNIPNILTLGNLVSGFFAIYFISVGSHYTAALLIGVGFVFDMLDGLVARMLGTSSELGVQLDSLADSVTFAIVPGFLVSSFYFQNDPLGLLVGSIIACSGIMRLAIFNLTDGLDYFKGMSTPYFTALVVGFIVSGVKLPEVVAAIFFSAMALMMVGPVKFPALKGKEFLRFKFAGIGLLIIVIVMLLLSVDLLITGITLDVLYGLFLLIFAFDKHIKKKWFAFGFMVVVFLATTVFYREPIQLIAYPLLLSVIFSPLIEYSRGKK